MATRPSSIGEIPKPCDGPSTGGTGIGAGGCDCATGGGVSTAGRTHPPAGACATAATAAAPHAAAAGAPPLSTLSIAHELTCEGAARLAAAAPVELTNIAPATRTLTTPLNPEQAILEFSWRRRVQA